VRSLHVWTPQLPLAAVLLLHGGREHGVDPVRPHNLALARMTPFAWALRRAGGPHGLAVARLRYTVRGWNGTEQSPVTDVIAALDALRERVPGAPVALVGHSMGGRAALHAAGHPAVSAVLGLAPWIEPGDPVSPVAGRTVVLAHGLDDRTTKPERSRQFVLAAHGVAARAAFVGVRGEGHKLLRRAGLWHGLVTDFVLATVCDVPASGVIGEALGGRTELEC